jgi:trk system potassium uptake protein TrkA
MKIVIVGCGRVGSTLAENLDADGHDVTIFDIRTSAFDRLPATFKGAAIRGDGTDEDVLRRGGVDGADVFLALTEGDNRNVMAAQMAQESLDIPQVVAKVNDPVRAAAYAELGLATICRTNIMVDHIARHLGLEVVTGPGIDVPEAGHTHPHVRPQPESRPEAETKAPEPERSPASRAQQVRPGDDKEAPDHEIDVRAQRLGFRRWRG